jgi:hypothetical protein
MKAFAVQEDYEGTGDIYYADHAITAKKRFANEFSDGELNGVTCHRAPWADQFSPGPCPRLVMIDNGWWMECHGCGIRIDSDLEHFLDDPEKPVEILKPVEDARGLFCTEECRDRHLADKSARQAAEEAARAAIEARLLDKIPGVTIAGRTHIYVVKRDDLYVPQQCRVAFDFPGSKIGPAHFGHNEVGEEPGVTVCAGDLAAWEAWRASLGKAVS